MLRAAYKYELALRPMFLEIEYTYYISYRIITYQVIIINYAITFSYRYRYNLYLNLAQTSKPQRNSREQRTLPSETGALSGISYLGQCGHSFLLLGAS